MQTTFTSFGLDRLDLEVEADERKDKALEVLDEVVETPQTVRVLAGVHVHLGTKQNYDLKFDTTVLR